MIRSLREKARDGAATLTDAELVSAFAGVAPSVPLAELAFDHPLDLVERLGCTEAKAVTLAAAFELGRRAAWKPPKPGDRCCDPQSVSELLRRESMESTESFYCVLLDVRGRLMRVVRVASGSISQCPVSPRDAFRPVVKSGAHSVVLAHNHPSGDPSPSPEDFDLTARLRAGGELLGITMRDHVIVASGGYYSFVEAGKWRR
jgi:DNA repair protein RadC